MEDTAPSKSRLLLEALEKRWKNYRVELKRCRAQFSNEAVHDVRIALRRLLSLIHLLNSVSPRPRLQRLQRAAKNQLDEFDDLRDTQVMLAEISETKAELPQLEELQDHLERAERRLLKRLRKKLKGPGPAEIARRIRKTRESLEGETKDDAEEQVIRSVDDAFAIVKQRHARIDPAQPATIHRVRVAFKKFRYMVEIVHPLLAGFPPENLKHMNNHQSLMGEIQDLEVFLQTLADFFSDVSSPDLEPVRRYYEQRHAEAVSAYLENKDVLHDFWRAAPDQPFPWEKTT